MVHLFLNDTHIPLSKQVQEERMRRHVNPELGQIDQSVSAPFRSNNMYWCPTHCVWSISYINWSPAPDHPHTVLCVILWLKACSHRTSWFTGTATSTNSLSEPSLTAAPSQLSNAESSPTHCLFTAFTNKCPTWWMLKGNDSAISFGPQTSLKLYRSATPETEAI